MEAKFKYYITERKGYVQTTVAYLRKLKISKLISQYSKQLDNKVFLEEDCDLYTFYKAMIDKGYTINITNINVDDFDQYLATK